MKNLGKWIFASVGLLCATYLGANGNSGLGETLGLVILAVLLFSFILGE